MSLSPQAKSLFNSFHAEVTTAAGFIATIAGFATTNLSGTQAVGAALVSAFPVVGKYTVLPIFNLVSQLVEDVAGLKAETTTATVTPVVAVTTPAPVAAAPGLDPNQVTATIVALLNDIAALKNAKPTTVSPTPTAQ